MLELPNTREKTELLKNSSINNISVIILTKNEANGILSTLEHLTDFSDVVVVDSQSEDATVAICAATGVRVVDFVWDQQYPKKKQWSIENAGVKNDWVLLLDADEYPSQELINELRSLDSSLASAGVGAFDIRLSYKFLGKFLRHGHVVTKRSLIHKNRCRFPDVGDLGAPGIREVEGHYQPQTKEQVDKLSGKILHDDKDPISTWFERHNRYSDWEAYLRLHPTTRSIIAQKRTRKGQFFDLMPLKPCGFFLYSYFVRLGFLDGRQGLNYALALSFYYWQIQTKHFELKQLR